MTTKVIQTAEYLNRERIHEKEEKSEYTIRCLNGNIDDCVIEWGIKIFSNTQTNIYMYMYVKKLFA